MNPTLLLQLLPLLQGLPGLIRDGVSIYKVIREDPGTPVEVRAKLDEIGADLDDALKLVAEVQLPSGK